MDAFRESTLFPKLKANGVSERETELLRHRWRINTLFGQVNHSIYSIYYRYYKKSSLGNYGSLFIESRPEYFAKGYKNAPSSLKKQYPDDPDLPPQLCFTNPEVVEYFADCAEKVFNRKKIKGGGYENIPRMEGMPFFYPFQEDDNGCFCKCPSCKKLLKKYDGSYAECHYDWIRRIAMAAAKKNKDIGISTLAYSALLPHPQKVELPENVSVQICLGLQSYFHPLVYSKHHGIYKDWIRNEGKKRPLTVWIYMLSPSWEARVKNKHAKFFPVLYPRPVGRYFKEFATDGIRGWFGEIDPVFHMLEAYVANRISYDASIDPDLVIDEYFSRYYGKAGDAMKEFYQKIEEITWNPDNYTKRVLQTMPKSSYTSGLQKERDNWHLGTPERIEKLQKIINKALLAASGSKEKMRVRKFVTDIWQQAVEGRKEFELREKFRNIPTPVSKALYAGECSGDPSKVNFAPLYDPVRWVTLDNKPDDTKIEFTLACDGKYLYIRYKEEGNYAKKTLSDKDSDFWMNNLEFFFAPRKELPFRQLVISPSGEFKAYKSQTVGGVNRMLSWDVTPKIISSSTDAAWTLLVAIPFSELKEKGVKPGETLYANFFRTRRIGLVKSLAWSPIFTDVYSAALYRMGTIQFAPKSLFGKIDVNGRFLKTVPGNLPDGWVIEKLANWKKSIKGISTTYNQVTIKSKENRIGIYYKKILNASELNQIDISFKAKGTGKSCTGVMLYGYRGSGAFNPIECDFILDGQEKDYTFRIPLVRKRPNGQIMGIRPYIGIMPGGEITVSDFRLEIKNKQQE